MFIDVANEWLKLVDEAFHFRYGFICGFSASTVKLQRIVRISNYRGVLRSRSCINLVYLSVRFSVF